MSASVCRPEVPSHMMQSLSSEDKRPKWAQERARGVEERKECSVSHHGKCKMSLIGKIKYN